MKNNGFFFYKNISHALMLKEYDRKKSNPANIASYISTCNIKTFKLTAYTDIMHYSKIVLRHCIMIPSIVRSLLPNNYISAFTLAKDSVIERLHPLLVF